MHHARDIGLKKWRIVGIAMYAFTDWTTTAGSSINVLQVARNLHIMG